MYLRQDSVGEVHGLKMATGGAAVPADDDADDDADDEAGEGLCIVPPYLLWAFANPRAERTEAKEKMHKTMRRGFGPSRAREPEAMSRRRGRRQARMPCRTGQGPEDEGGGYQMP